MNKIKKLSVIKTLILSILCVFIIMITIDIFAYVQDHSNNITTYNLSIDDFEQVSLKKLDNNDYSFIATDGDSQLILTINDNVTNVYYDAEFSVPAGEIIMYYTNNEIESFSTKKSIYLNRINNSNTYFANINAMHIYNLRLDITNIPGNKINISNITINKVFSINKYFAISYSKVYNLFVYSLILFCILFNIQTLPINKK